MTPLRTRATDGEAARVTLDRPKLKRTRLAPRVDIRSHICYNAPR